MAVAQVASTGQFLNSMIGLYTGDEYSRSCPNRSLARLICELAQPRSATALFELLYGDWPLEAIAEEERLVLAESWQAWQKRGR